MTSIRKLGSPTCSPASPSIQPTGSTSCCRGTGGVLATSWAGRPDDGRHPLRLHDLPRRQDARRGRGVAAGDLPQYGPRGGRSLGYRCRRGRLPSVTEYGIECLKQIIIEERALLARKRNPNT